jgi:hypothetical protein
MMFGGPFRAITSLRFVLDKNYFSVASPIHISPKLFKFDPIGFSHKTGRPADSERGTARWFFPPPTLTAHDPYLPRFLIFSIMWSCLDSHHILTERWIVPADSSPASLLFSHAVALTTISAIFHAPASPLSSRVHLHRSVSTPADPRN